LAGAVSFPLPSFLTADGAIRMVQSVDRLIAWATAMKMQGLARIEEAIGEESPPRRQGQPVRFGGDEAHALAVTEVATASEGSAGRSLNDAADLCSSQWPVLEALAEGNISSAHARIILELARSLPEGKAEEFGVMALRKVATRQGRRRTPSELRACLRPAQERLHPESLTARKEAAHRERGVWFSPERDGMCTLTAHLAAEVGLAIYNGLELDAQQASMQLVSARAAGLGNEQGRLKADWSSARPALRADALVHRLLGGAEGSCGAPFRAEVVVTVPVGMVIEDCGGSADSAAMQGMAEFEGYGPIDAPAARRLAALAPNWQRLFTNHTTGHALGMGRTAYRPPKALLRYLHSRDGTCRFPGCRSRATACEPDHIIEWQDGGTTNASNLAMLCRRHHALKSIGAWTYKPSTETGNLAWRSPTGRTYTTEAVAFAPATEAVAFAPGTEAVAFAPGLHPLKAPEPPPF
jgi:hypothetical protein